MNRYVWCSLLVLAACLAIAGCRRGAATPREPYPADLEGDILKGSREKAIMFTARPPDRRYRVWLESIYKIEAEFKNEDKLKTKLKEVCSDQDKIEKDKDASAKMQEGKKVADDAEGQLEFAEFAEKALKYYKLKKDAPKEFTNDLVYKYLRRHDFFFQKKHVDKATWEIVSDDIYLVNYMDESIFAVSPAVDMQALVSSPPKTNRYIVAFRNGGPEVCYSDGDLGQELALTKELRAQELRILRLYFIKYAAPLLIRPPLNPAETKQMRDFLGAGASYEGLLDQMRYGKPWEVLRSVDQVVPFLAKNPAENREPEKFEAFLKDNAPPSIAQSLKDRFLSVNFAVELRNDRSALQNIVACRTVPYEYEDAMSKRKYYLHHVVYSDGTTSEVSPQFVQGFLQAAPTKTEPTPGSGGGGGPGMGKGMPGMAAPP